jgi:hypothetical protein
LTGYHDCRGKLDGPKPDNPGVEGVVIRSTGSPEGMKTNRSKREMEEQKGAERATVN